MAVLPSVAPSLPVRHAGQWHAGWPYPAVFMKIRSGISKYSLQYEWFKIRNGNGNGSF
jgi:hypothetical protein